MAGEPVSLPAGQTLTDEQGRRWSKVLGLVADALPSGAVAVVIDGADATHAGVVADRLADTLHASGRPCARLGATTPLADGPGDRRRR